MALYSNIKKDGEQYTVQLPTRTITVQDDLPYLEYFANGGSVKEFMANVNIWGEDLTEYKGFADTVCDNISKINKNVCIL